MKSLERSPGSRTGIVTGAGAGIGRAISRTLLSSGVDIVGIDCEPGGLGELQLEFGSSPGRFLPVDGDAASAEVLRTAFETCKREFAHGPSIVVVNAGRGLQGSVLTSDPAMWQGTFSTNYIGALRLLRRAAQAMLEDGKGTGDMPRDIVYVGSATGRRVTLFNAVYGAGKAGIHAATEGLRLELATLGVRASLIEPGIVATQFQKSAGYDLGQFADHEREIGPFLAAEDVARLVHFIVSQPAHIHISNAMIRPTRQVMP